MTILKSAAKEYITLWFKAISEDKCEEFEGVFRETLQIADAAASGDGRAGGRRRALAQLPRDATLAS